MTLLSLSIVWILLQGVAQSLSVPALGPTGGQLTADDLTQIQRLANEGGGDLWLVIAGAPEFGRSKDWHVTVYLRPDSQSHGVRRGRALLLHAALDDFNAYARPKTWRTWRAPEGYAQVPVADTDPDNVPDSRDLNRPFPVVASRSLDPPSLSNESIAQIVSLVRASPAIESSGYRDHPLAQVSQTRVEGTWPINRIAVIDASTISVSNLHPSETRGQLLTLRHDGTSWRLQGIGMFVN